MRFSRLKKQIEESGRPPAAQQSTSKPNNGKAARSQAQTKTAANNKGKAPKAIPAWSACIAAAPQTSTYRASSSDCPAFPSFPLNPGRFHRPSLPVFIDLTLEPDDDACTCPADLSDEDVPLIKRRRIFPSSPLMERCSKSSYPPQTVLPMKDLNVSTDRGLPPHRLSQGNAGPSAASGHRQPQVIDLTRDDEPVSMGFMPNSAPVKDNAAGPVESGRDTSIDKGSFPQPSLADADVALFGDGLCEPFSGSNSSAQQKQSSQQHQAAFTPPVASSQQPLAYSYDERHPYSWVFQLLDHPEATGSTDAPPEIDLTPA